MDGNYIKINRKILDWEWYKNEHTKNLFLHCLLKANWKDGKFEGKIVGRGSFITSIKKLSSELNLTEDEVRTALKHLIETGEVTKQTTNKYTVITVNNYGVYQEVTNQFPNKSQTIPKPFPTIEEGKKERKEEYNNTSCLERKTSLSLADVEAIPLNDGTEWSCPIDDYNEYVRLYPAVDVRQAFRDMRAWSLSNREKRKTRRGVKRFVNSWLSKVQDRGGQRPATQSKSPVVKNNNNFERRNYDMDDLESKLLGGNHGAGNKA